MTATSEKPDYEMLEFKNASLFRDWLDTNHTNVDGIWLKMYKKASGIESIDYAGALDEALCYGWIDGQRKSLDEVSYLQKFTPRRRRSIWSKRNLEYIERLTIAGKMMPRGFQEVEAAKADGRWDAAYDKPNETKVSEYFLEELKKHPKAEQFFSTLNKTNIYAITWRLQTVKTDAGRKRRMDTIIEMLNNEQKFH